MEDSLESMFKLREKFMLALNERVPENSVDWPLDISKKSSQQYCRDVALRGVEEMFEALQHLKNWKPHRQTEISDFNREDFLEEIVDAFNYFFSILVLLGFDHKDLYDAYVKKDSIIHERLEKGY